MLVWGKKRIDGKNYNAKTILHRGGGHKRNFRLVDYYMYIWNVYGIVIKQLFDANKKVMVNLVSYCNGILNCVISVCGIVVGDIIINGFIKRDVGLGCTTFIFNIKSGALISLLELKVNVGSQYCRSSGMYGKLYTTLLAHTAIVKLKSKKKMIVNSFAWQLLG